MRDRGRAARRYGEPLCRAMDRLAWSGATPFSAVEPDLLASTGTRVMTWSNCEGEGISGSSLCCDPIRTDVDSNP